MKYHTYLLATVIILFAACQNQTTELNNSKEIALDSNVVNVSDVQCYTYIKNRDTANLSFTTTNGIIVGELSYQLYEKDSNKGMIEGEMKGDTLMLDYTFNSEGKESERQVIFLKKDDQLFEGFGDMEEKKGKLIFNDISSLNFKGGIVFKKIDCNKKGY